MSRRISAAASRPIFNSLAISSRFKLWRLPRSRSTRAIDGCSCAARRFCTTSNSCLVAASEDRSVRFCRASSWFSENRTFASSSAKASRLGAAFFPLRGGIVPPVVVLVEILHRDCHARDYLHPSHLLITRDLFLTGRLAELAANLCGQLADWAVL